MEMERRFAKQPNKTFLGAALEAPHSKSPKGLASCRVFLQEHDQLSYVIMVELQQKPRLQPFTVGNDILQLFSAKYIYQGCLS